MASNPCEKERDLIMLLGKIYGNNASIINYHNAASGDGNIKCHLNDSGNAVIDHYAKHMDTSDLDYIPDNTFAHKFYAYLTPFIILIGIAGNIASVCVFTSKRLRRLSASHYLSALSVSDTTVLMTYVLLQWLHRGLPQWPGSHSVPIVVIEGVCNVFVFVSYTFRVASVYLVVVFTIERYIAVCKPLRRRIICTKTFARKLIIFVFVFGAVVSLYKPFLSGVYEISFSESTGERVNIQNGFDNKTGDPFPTFKPVADKVCSRNGDYHDLNFIFELTYGLLIMAVPFLIMIVFNTLIIRKLILRFSDKAQLQSNHRETKIRWEFTVMLLAVSTCFILLNLPYFIVWVRQVLSTKAIKFEMINKLKSQVLLTRTIFSLNYCINFFVYCLTGSYYRSAITDWICCHRKKDPNSNGYSVVRLGSMTTHGTVV